MMGQDMKRIGFIDYIRVIACFLVMLVHSSEFFYVGDPDACLANEANRFWVAFYDGTVARTCVPLFMIVSAFLLVPMKPGMTMHQFYKRRFMRILPPLIIFQLLYTFVPVLEKCWTMDDALSNLWLVPFNFSPQAGHLWFMFPLISLYLIIPVVSPWLERSSAREELTFIGLFAFSTFLPWLHRFVTPELWGECFWNQFTMLWYCSGYLGYLVLAHYIRRHLKWSTGKRLLIGSLCFVAGAIFTGWSFWWKGVPGVHVALPDLEWSWAFCTPNVLLATFGAFILFTCIKQPEAPRFVTGIAKLTYGMYLMHILILTLVARLFISGDITNPAMDVANPLLPVWAAIPVIAVCTYACCLVITKLISYLPGSKYIIG